MSKVLIIGYGNPLRGDDGFGIEVARCLKEIIRDEPVEILAQHQLMPELADPVSRALLVIFVDARVGDTPGQWSCEEVKPAEQMPQPVTHHFTPAALLAYAQMVFGACPRALVVSTVAASFECGERLSPAVAAAVPEVVKFIGEQVRAARQQA
jgi:hydrogenase maturation protease